MIYFASATITIVSPANGGTLTGTTAVLNVTNVTNTFDSMTNCTFYLKSASTNATVWTRVGLAINDTGIGNSINITFDSARFEDSNDYILNASCLNSSIDRQEALTTASLILQSTTPTAPATLSPTSDDDGIVNFSAIIVDRETTNVYLNFSEGNPGLSVYTMSCTDTSCSYQLTGVPEQTYKWFVTATDGTDSSRTSQTTDIDITTSAGKVTQLISSGEVKSEGGATYSIAGKGLAPATIGWIVVVLVLAGAVIGIVVFVKRKK